MNRVFILFLFIVLITACNKMRVKRVVAEWISKEIVIQDSLVFTIKGVDTINLSLDTTRFKLLTYVSTESCFECKARLKDWSLFIDSLADSGICVPQCIFIYNTHMIVEPLFLFEEFDFKYPVCLDVNGCFSEVNKFHALEPYQTVLLNESNEIVLIGSPVNNRVIRKIIVDTLMKIKDDYHSQSQYMSVVEE